MLPPAAEYGTRPRNPIWERELSQKLRAVPEAERLQFIQDFALFNTVVALEIAQKCLCERRSFEVLLDRAIDEADPSGLRYWLACVMPRLGFRRVVSILREQARTRADRVALAAYWLPSFSSMPGFSRDAVNSLRMAHD